MSSTISINTMLPITTRTNSINNHRYRLHLSDWIDHLPYLSISTRMLDTRMTNLSNEPEQIINLSISLLSLTILSISFVLVAKFGKMSFLIDTSVDELAWFDNFVNFLPDWNVNNGHNDHNVSGYARSPSPCAMMKHATCCVNQCLTCKRCHNM